MKYFLNYLLGTNVCKTLELSNFDESNYPPVKLFYSSKTAIGSEWPMTQRPI